MVICDSVIGFKIQNFDAGDRLRNSANEDLPLMGL
jgi:hypothetical protein